MPLAAHIRETVARGGPSLVLGKDWSHDAAMAGHSTVADWPPAPPRAEREHRNNVGGYQQAAPTVINSLTAEHGFTGFCVSKFIQTLRTAALF